MCLWLSRVEGAERVHYCLRHTKLQWTKSRGSEFEQKPIMNLNINGKERSHANGYSLVSVTVLSITTKNYLGKKGLHFLVTIYQWGNSGREHGGRNWSRHHGGLLLTGLPCSAIFLKQPRIICLGMIVPNVDRVLNVSQDIFSSILWPQANLIEAVFNWDFLTLGDIKLCPTDNKN